MAILMLLGSLVIISLSLSLSLSHYTALHHSVFISLTRFLSVPVPSYLPFFTCLSLVCLPRNTPFPYLPFHYFFLSSSSFLSLTSPPSFPCSPSFHPVSPTRLSPPPIICVTPSIYVYDFFFLSFLLPLP